MSNPEQKKFKKVIKARKLRVIRVKYPNRRKKQPTAEHVKLVKAIKKDLEK